MKVIKEGIGKLPEMEKKAQTVVDVVMADAKEYSDKATDNFEKVVGTIDKFDRKKPFTSGEHQPKPEEAEKELAKISLDESLFEDYEELNEMAKQIPRAMEVIERKKAVGDLRSVQPDAQFIQDAKDIKSAEQYALEWILAEHDKYTGATEDEPIYDIYWAAYDPDTMEKTDINIYAKRILSLNDILKDYRRANTSTPRYDRRYINARDILIAGEADTDFWYDDSKVDKIQNALNNNQVVMQYAVTPMNSNWKTFKEPRAGQAIGNNSLRWGRNPLKGESLSIHEALEDYDEADVKGVDQKYEDLSAYNFDFGLISEEDRQEAIDECTRILNILNNISIEDIEIFNSLNTEAGIENEIEDDSEIANESLNEKYSIKAKEYMYDIEKYLHDNKFWAIECEPINSEEGVMDTSIVTFRVSGDWKHEHLAFNDFVKEWAEKNNKIIWKIDTDVVEEDGSDDYVGDHIIYIIDDKETYDRLNSIRGLFVQTDESLSTKLTEGVEIAAVSELAKAAKDMLFMQPWKAKEVLMNNKNLVNDFIKSGLSAEKYFQKQLDYYGTKKYVDWFASGCPTKYVQNFGEELTKNLEEQFNLINYTANAMKERGLAEEIQMMRAKALSEDYSAICGNYLDRCNRIANEVDDEYEITGLPFVTQGLDIQQPQFSLEDLQDMYLGKMIRLSMMVDPMQCADNNCYNNCEGTVEVIDDNGQLHGSWGGLAVIPGIDNFEVI